MFTRDDIVGIGGQITAKAVLAAYCEGVFPMTHQGVPEPIWWCPRLRYVIELEELRYGRSLRKVLRSGRFKVTFDQEFPQVIRECADKRYMGREKTGINESMIDAYTKLHDSGVVHSVEVWRDAELVGGLYGVAIGPVFFGESMFAHESNASKVGLVTLAEKLREWEFTHIDCQMETPVMSYLGGKYMPRSEFVKLVVEGRSSKLTKVGKWVNE